MQMTMSRRRFVIILILTAVLSMVLLGVFLTTAPPTRRPGRGSSPMTP